MEGKLSIRDVFREFKPPPDESDVMEVLRLPRRVLNRLKRLVDVYSLGDRSCVCVLNEKENLIF